MNKKLNQQIGEILLAVLAGCNKVMTIFTPVAIVMIWIALHEVTWSTYVLAVVGLLSTLFRGIQVWLD